MPSLGAFKGSAVALLWPCSSLWGEESAVPREEPGHLL